MSNQSDEIYVITCSDKLVSMGMNRLRTATEGLSELHLSLDWPKATLVPVISEEKAQFNTGETRVVKIRQVKVPALAVVLQSFYGSNGMGHLFCIGSTEFKTVREDRIADRAMFQSRIKASVLPDDLLGQVIIVPGKP